MRSRTKIAARVVLACVLPLGICTLLLGADPCVQFAKDDSCNYAAGCNLTISKCGAGAKQADCDPQRESKSLINKFTCVTIAGAGSTCDPATAGGAAAVVACMNEWTCLYSQPLGKCVPSMMPTSCMSPYYVTTPCDD